MFWVFVAACAPADSASTAGAEAPPAEEAEFSFLGCVEHVSWSAAPGTEVYAGVQLLYVDAERQSAWDGWSSWGSWWVRAEWSGACQVHYGQHEVYDDGAGYVWGFDAVIETTCDEYDQPLLRTVDTSSFDATTVQPGGARAEYDNSYEAGRLTEQSEHRWELDGDWVDDAVTTFEYDDEGRLVVEDYRSWLSYDALVEYDWVDDQLSRRRYSSEWGVSLEDYAYDERGRLTLETRVESADGQTTQRARRYSYADDTPRVALTEESSDDWDTVEEVAVSTWVCP